MLVYVSFIRCLFSELCWREEKGKLAVERVHLEPRTLPPRAVLGEMLRILQETALPLRCPKLLTV